MLFDVIVIIINDQLLFYSMLYISANNGIVTIRTDIVLSMNSKSVCFLNLPCDMCRDLVGLKTHDIQIFQLQLQ